VSTRIEVRRHHSPRGFTPIGGRLLQRAEDEIRGRRRCAEDDAIRATTELSHRQVGATRRAGTFLGVSRAFVSSGVPERTPGGRGWRGLAGWMKAQIRAKTRNRGCDWAVFHRPDEKRLPGPRRGHGWRCSKVEVVATRRWPSRARPSVCSCSRWMVGRQRSESITRAPASKCKERRIGRRQACQCTHERNN
jgi:hypothetical protein